MEKFLAIIVAVMVERWTRYIPGGQIIARVRSANWLDLYLAKMGELIGKLGVKQSYMVFFFLLLPLVLLVFIAKIVFSHLLGKIIGSLLVATLLLLYFIGNKEVEANSSDFVTAHEANFGILFWFAIFGPVGGLFYWFIVAVKQLKSLSEDSTISLIHALAAWVPARITGFVYALVGNFTLGFNQWLTCMRATSMPSSEFLETCGRAALDSSSADEQTNLIDRAFIAWVAISILIVIV